MSTIELPSAARKRNQAIEKATSRRGDCLTVERSRRTPVQWRARPDERSHSLTLLFDVAVNACGQVGVASLGFGP